MCTYKTPKQERAGVARIWKFTGLAFRFASSSIIIPVLFFFFFTSSSSVFDISLQTRSFLFFSLYIIKPQQPLGLFLRKKNFFFFSFKKKSSDYLRSSFLIRIETAGAKRLYPWLTVVSFSLSLRWQKFSVKSRSFSRDFAIILFRDLIIQPKENKEKMRNLKIIGYRARFTICFFLFFFFF